MKITIPHMGNVYIAAKILFDGLGIDYAIPSLNNKEALILGARYSPEEICLPFKLMIGNYIDGIKDGADTVLIVGSCGPCRFGEYCELQIRILQSLGYKMDFIVIDPVRSIGIRELMRRICRIGSDSKKNTINKLKAPILALKAINLIDDMEKEAHMRAGYEKQPGECKRLLKNCKDEVFACDNPDKALEILKDYHRKIKYVSVDPYKSPLKIAIIGEIYTVIEPFSNLYIEDILTGMQVSVSRTLTPSWWLKDALLKMIKMNSRELLRASNEFLPLYIGGHARECVGEAILAANMGFDGAIQIFPMGCMPEIVSKAILPSISREKNIPVLSLVVDEMTGEAGYLTRVEAFIDLLERRRGHVRTGS